MKLCKTRLSSCLCKGSSLDPGKRTSTRANIGTRTSAENLKNIIYFGPRNHFSWFRSENLVPKSTNWCPSYFRAEVTRVEHRLLCLDRVFIQFVLNECNQYFLYPSLSNFVIQHGSDKPSEKK